MKTLYVVSWFYTVVWQYDFALTYAQTRFLVALACSPYVGYTFKTWGLPQLVFFLVFVMLERTFILDLLKSFRAKNNFGQLWPLSDTSSQNTKIKTKYFMYQIFTTKLPEEWNQLVSVLIKYIPDKDLFCKIKWNIKLTAVGSKFHSL